MSGESQAVRCCQEAKLQVMRGRGEAGETIRTTVGPLMALVQVKEHILPLRGDGVRDSPEGFKERELT